MDFALAIIALVFFMESYEWTQGITVNSTDDFNELTKLLNGVEGKNHLKLIRPPSGAGKAVNVRVGIHIVYIGNFRESDMEYTIEMYFRQYWRDPRLVFPGLNQTVTFSGDIPNILWEPDTYFENGISGKFHHLTALNKYLRLYPDGRVLVSTRLTLSCSCDMNFRKFPMDTQMCDLYFASYGFTTQDLIYSWNDELVSYASNKESAQFSMESWHYLNGTRTYATGDFSYLGIRFVFARRLSFYLTKVYIPAMLVVIVSWLSFFVDKNSAPARVSLGITTVLTMTTLIMGFGQGSLPAVSYVRALDWYLIVCYLLVFASFAEYAVVNYKNNLLQEFTSKSSGLEEILTSERILSGVVSYPLSDRDVQNNVMISGPEHKFSMDSKSRDLDNWSRLIFLPTFLVLNVLYWVYYLVIDQSNA